MGKNQEELTVEQLLEEKPFINRKIIYGVLLIWVLIGVVYRYSQKGSSFFSFNFEEFKFLAESFYGVSLSLIAAVVYSIIYGHREPEKIREINKLSLKEIIVKSLQYIKLKGRYYCTNENVNIKLKQHDNPNLINCSVDYSYRKTLWNKNIKLLIEVEKGKDKLNDISFDPMEYEFYFKLDEQEIGEGVTKNDDYYVNYFTVENSEIALKKDEGDKGYEFTGKIDENIKYEELVKFSYGVTFPMEKSSVFFIKMNIPTKQLHVVFDYQELKDEISVFSEYLISTADDSVSHISNNHKVIIEYPGWSMPENCVIFSWWKK